MTMKIRYYGHAGQLTGYGRAAENMIAALMRAGADVEIRTLAPYDTLRFDTPHLPLASRLRTDAQLSPSPDVVIVHTLPLDCAKVVQIAAPTVDTRTPDKRPIWIAYTTWEALSPPPDALMTSLEIFDEVWHPSPHPAFQTALERDGGAFRVVPHAFFEANLERYRARPAKVEGAPYRFYTVGAFTARKNPIAIVRAFVHAFDKANNVELLMACAGMTQAHLTHAICATGFPPDDIPPIRSDFRPLTEEQLWALHQGADCYVSASRGEAWNLPAFEAILAGRHVIAPFGLGHSSFLNGTSAHQYPTHPMPAMVETRQSQSSQGTQIQTVGAQGLTSKSLWFEPDVLALAKGMRAAYDQDIRTISISYDITRYGYTEVGSDAVYALQRCQKGITKP